MKGRTTICIDVKTKALFLKAFYDYKKENTERRNTQAAFLENLCIEYFTKRKEVDVGWLNVP